MIAWLVGARASAFCAARLGFSVPQKCMPAMRGFTWTDARRDGILAPLEKTP